MLDYLWGVVAVAALWVGGFALQLWVIQKSNGEDGEDGENEKELGCRFKIFGCCGQPEQCGNRYSSE